MRKQILSGCRVETKPINLAELFVQDEKPPPRFISTENTINYKLYAGKNCIAAQMSTSYGHTAQTRRRI